MYIKSYKIINTGYTGQSMSLIDNYDLSYTGTNTTEYYSFTTETSSSTSTTRIRTTSSSSTTETANTMTSTTEEIYTTTTGGGASTTAGSTITITGTVEDYTYDTIYYKNEYVSISYNRGMGGQANQNNYYFTDRYSYEFTSDYGGISVTNRITTGTSGTYSRSVSSTYEHFGYVYDNWWSTDTVWNYPYTYTYWTSTSSDYYDTFWSDWRTSRVDTVGTQTDYVTTTTMSWVYGPSWTLRTDTYSYRSNYEQTSQADIVVTSYVSSTNRVNTVSTSYINNSTETDKFVIMQLLNSGTNMYYTVQAPFSGYNSIYSMTVNMGLNTAATTSSSTTFVYYG